MEVDGIGEYMEDNWARIEEQILARTYKPKPVKRVEIPKDSGGVRLLGVPCVIDRVIQQAMVQVLQPARAERGGCGKEGTGVHGRGIQVRCRPRPVQIL